MSNDSNEKHMMDQKKVVHAIIAQILAFFSGRKFFDLLEIFLKSLKKLKSCFHKKIECFHLKEVITRVFFP